MGGYFWTRLLARSTLHAGSLPSAIIANAKDDDAQSFYEHYGFQLLPTERHDRRLFLPMGTVERLFAG